MITEQNDQRYHLKEELILSGKHNPCVGKHYPYRSRKRFRSRELRGLRIISDETL